MAKQSRRLTRRDVVVPADTGERVADLERKLAKARTPQVSKSKLTLRRDNICVANAVFQWRLPGRDEAARTEHILDMAKSVRDTGGPLEAILVFPVGGAFYVVDGHHRLAAYDTARWSKTIPAVVFEGTFRAALIRALTENSRNKLALTRAEKSEAAWRLVREFGRTLDALEIRKASGVSRRTVFTMQAKWEELRKIFKQRGEALPDDLLWTKAQTLLKGREDAFDSEAWIEAEAQKMVDRLRKANLGPNLTKQPEITARALRLISDNLPRALIEEWLGNDHELREELVEHYTSPPEQF